MTSPITRLNGGKRLPCPHAGSCLPGALSLFLVRLPGDLLVGSLRSPPLPLKMEEEEAESSEARRGQSLGNNGYIPGGKGALTQMGQWFSVVFLDPKCIRWRLSSWLPPGSLEGEGCFLLPRSGHPSQRGIPITDKDKGEESCLGQAWGRW